jgi:hypothetical protein
MRKELKLLRYACILALAVAAVQVGTLGMKAKRLLAAKTPASMGMGTQLSSTVNGLEREIGERLAYEVRPGNDPLNLGKVLGRSGAGGQKQEFVESKRPIRLSCTILSSAQSTAILKYKGKSYVVAPGDSLASMKVVSIDKQQVVLNDGGKEVVLINEPAPPSEIRSRGRNDIDELRL